MLFRELLEHARLHGEELATVHQQNTDFQSSSPKRKTQQSISDDGKLYNFIRYF